MRCRIVDGIVWLLDGTNLYPITVLWSVSFQWTDLFYFCYLLVWPYGRCMRPPIPVAPNCSRRSYVITRWGIQFRYINLSENARNPWSQWNLRARRANVCYIIVIMHCLHIISLNLLHSNANIHCDSLLACLFVFSLLLSSFLFDDFLFFFMLINSRVIFLLRSANALIVVCCFCAVPAKRILKHIDLT